MRKDECVVCTRMISAERRAANPWTDTCEGCGTSVYAKGSGMDTNESTYVDTMPIIVRPDGTVNVLRYGYDGTICAQNEYMIAVYTPPFRDSYGYIPAEYHVYEIVNANGLARGNGFEYIVKAHGLTWPKVAGATVRERK